MYMTKLLIFLLVTGFLSASVLSNEPRSNDLPSSIIDTLVDANGHKLHFTIWKGKSPAILFETGAGDDLSVWNDIRTSIYKNTGATLIAYDRAGFGKSELDTNQLTLNQQLTSLEYALKNLGINSKLFLVSHSFGGYFSTLIADRHPDKVVGAVLIDPNQVSFWTDSQTKHTWAKYEPMKAKFKQENQGVYWLMVNAYQNAKEMRQVSFPTTIPVIDIVAETPPHDTKEENDRWKQAQQKFVAAATNRQLIMASGSGHYIMRDKPDLVIRTITKLYQDTKNK